MQVSVDVCVGGSGVLFAIFSAALFLIIFVAMLFLSIAFDNGQIISEFSYYKFQFNLINLTNIFTVD